MGGIISRNIKPEIRNRKSGLQAHQVGQPAREASVSLTKRMSASAQPRRKSIHRPAIPPFRLFLPPPGFPSPAAACPPTIRSPSPRAATPRAKVYSLASFSGSSPTTSRPRRSPFVKPRARSSGYCASSTLRTLAGMLSALPWHNRQRACVGIAL